MSNPFKDCYKILGISRDAEITEIETAYKKLSKKLKPTKSSENAENNTQFQEIQEAYDTLKNPQLREQHDQELQQQEKTRDNQTFLDINMFRDLAMEPDESDWIDTFFSLDTLPPHQLDENLKIFLTQRESSKGGVISIDLPSYFGLGFGFNFQPRRRFNLRVPAGVSHGDVKDIYVPELDFWIRVQFSIFH